MLMKIDEALKTLMDAGYMVNEADEPSARKLFEEGEEVAMLDRDRVTICLGKVVAVEALRGSWTYEIDWYETKRTNKVAEEGEDFAFTYGTHGRPYTYPVIDIFFDMETGDVAEHDSYQYSGYWKQKDKYSGRFKRADGIYLTKATERFTKHVHVARIQHGDEIAAWKERNPDVKLVKKEAK